MCHQFALLIHNSLNHLGIYSKTVTGKATYSDEYTWDHYWVITKNEVIDANTDTMAENIMVSVGIDPLRYWGAIKKIPNDRRLKKNPQMKVAKDSDVSNIWWPKLRSWLKKI